MPDALAGRIYKTLKVGMIKGGANLTEKFKMAKTSISFEMQLFFIDLTNIGVFFLDKPNYQETVNV